MTDLEGPAIRRPALVLVMSEHPPAIRDVLEASGGRTVGPRRDGAVLCLFRTVAEAATAVLAAQRRFPVTAGVHVADMDADADAQAAFRTCDALVAVSGTGRTVLSADAGAAVADALPTGAWLRDLGPRSLPGRTGPEPTFELIHDDITGASSAGHAERPAHNLPAQLTTFVGRVAELATLRELLEHHRLVTVTGAGGSGKTRLAWQLAAGMADSTPAGVWWVGLSSITDPDLVPRALASAVHAFVDPSGDVASAVAAQLRGRHALVCLDTCEHLLDACAHLVHQVLTTCPEATVLATSRERLGVAGELVWRTPPLEADDAARLFGDRAALVRVDPADPGEDAVVRAICRRLDGLPLAIELAAAWTRVLTPSAIATRLDDRFRLLVGGPRGVDDRHRTLAASIGWSHDLLAASDQALLHALSVFSGGFTAEAAAAVCGGDTLAGITRLIDKSLVVVETRTAERFRLLDSIREYASRELQAAGRSAALRDRHLDFYVAFAESAAPRLERDQDRWRVALLAEHDNLRAALEWGFAARDPDRARRLAAALARFWFLTTHAREGRGFLDRALAAAPQDRTALQASLLSGAGLLAIAGGLSADACRLAERALVIADALDDDANRGRSHLVLGAGLFYTDRKAMERHSREAERFALTAGDPFVVDAGCLLRARTRTNIDRHAEAASLVRGRFAAARARGERAVGGFLLAVEVWAALFTGDLRTATRLGREAVATTRPLGDLYSFGHMTVNLAWVTGLRGDLAAAERLLEPILGTVSAAAGPELLKLFALVPGKLRLWAGDHTEAVRWFETAARFGEPVTDNWHVTQALPGLAAAQRRLGRTDEARIHAERALRLAATLDMPHIRADALEELAFLAATPGAEEDLHHQALNIRTEASLWTFVVHSYDALAGCAATAGDPRKAARVLGASDAARTSMDHPRPPGEQPDHDGLLTRLRADLGAAALADAMAEGAALSRDDLHAYLVRSRATRRRPVTGWDGLTRAEREVVALVADGLTNPQIGARLFMSRSTVKTHLAHVFAKLGITSRAELAAAAARHADPDA
ncbi:LuxR C-terminal-related transcriptional regulator [Pseudonocardia sp. MH-G8]|uniref:helix-turn-helix transcriptional regulator n=1 Tax=Pseudonocardia sp. MH-G8 TaxID=1854588 RepID=UPI000BA0875F|nr:LuxR C-terminal-related transcriptional regulator [Pseudonocardia sp. MH-G8]OZM82121.1 LuxR family transcriptional regulator [Pseudonocardia sp. MH-G8]